MIGKIILKAKDGPSITAPLLMCFFICLQYERTFLMLIKKEGTSVRNQLVKSMEFNESLDMMYLAEDGSISKRRIKVLQVGEVSFRAYYFLRKSKRTFIIDNVLALVPVYEKESLVI